MKAAQISTYGDADVVIVNADAPKPTAGQGQILVEVHAAGVNPVDSMVRLGYMQKMIPLTFPATLGMDAAGVVVDVGPGVNGFKVGDRVYGSAGIPAGGSGAFAEYAVMQADRAAAAPANLSFVEAAALPLPGVSALQALTEHMKLRSGQKVLIHGGAGGIGSLAIQLARHLGASVATTVIDDAGAAFVAKLGAQEIINAKKQDFQKIIRDYDAVYDTIGGETFKRSHEVLKKGGVIVSMLEQPDAALSQKHGVAAFGQFTQVNAERLGKLRALVDEGAMKVNVDRVFPLDRVKDAFIARESGTVLGKAVLQIRGN